MKYFIIAGEPSGDLHGSNLIRGLKASDGEAEIICWGGELMEHAGGRLLMHYRRLAIMGLMAILLNIRTIAKNLTLCKKQLREFNPDVLILIDFPSFNLRIARFAKTLGIKVFYYISPKIWAWKESRIKKIKSDVDRMFIIFPFEVDFYRKHNVEVEYYGNPLVDEIERKRLAFGDRNEMKKSLGLDDRPVIALLAGSRKHEVSHILPEMIRVVSYYPGYQFVLACVKNLPEKLYSDIIGDLPVKMISDKTYEILWLSQAAVVTSGTATLETALIGIPQVVCYKGDPVSFAIARRLVKVRFISLVNLIMGKEVVTELIQFLLTEKNLVNELNAIISAGAGREKMLSEYENLRNKLGPAGASSRIALEMIKSLKKVDINPDE